jgi:hypothetical protein
LPSVFKGNYEAVGSDIWWDLCDALMAYPEKNEEIERLHKNIICKKLRG